MTLTYSNAIRNDLIHPNEYVRGATLRFLSKLKEEELIEPLVSSVKANLEHRHSYVRKHAVLAIQAIHKLNANLIPDAAILLGNHLANELDGNCKRNALIALMQCDLDAALQWLHQNTEQILASQQQGTATSAETTLFQIACLSLIKRDQNVNADNIEIVVSLLNSTSHAVKYEAANTLMALTQTPQSIREVGSSFIARH